jgi:hypothetical protein
MRVIADGSRLLCPAKDTVSIFSVAGPNLAPQLATDRCQPCESAAPPNRVLAACQKTGSKTISKEIHYERGLVGALAAHRNPDREPAARRATDVALEGQDAIRSRACAALERKTIAAINKSDPPTVRLPWPPCAHPELHRASATPRVGDPTSSSPLMPRAARRRTSTPRSSPRSFHSRV